MYKRCGAGLVLVWLQIGGVFGCMTAPPVSEPVDDETTGNDPAGNGADVRGAWESRGIGGGGALFSVTLSPHDPDTVFMATDMSTTFRTRDFGESWEFLDFREIQGSVDTHVRFTSDPDVLYAVYSDWDGYRYPIVSQDGGDTWSPTASDPTDSETFSLDADPASTQRLLVAAWDTLYFSNDGGQSFAQVYQGPQPDYGLRVAGVLWDGDRIFVGTQYGLLVSTNGGASFALAGVPGLPAGTGLLTMAGAREGDDVRLIATTRASQDMWPGMTGAEWWELAPIYRLDWGAASWARVTDLPSGVRPFFVATASNDIDVVYASGGHADLGVPTVYKSVDGGDSWASSFHTDANQNIVTGWCGDGGDLDWWWAEGPLGFAVAPNDSDRIVMSDWGFVHVSDDGGANWRQGYVEPSFANPAGQPTPSGRAYETAGMENTSVWWLHWHNADVVLAGFTDVAGLRSTDGGVSWVSGYSLGLPEDNTYHIVEHPTTRTLYAALSSVHDLYQSAYLTDNRIDPGAGMVAYSTDGGESWDTLHDFGHPVIWLALDPNAANTMYTSVVHSSAGGVFVTKNLDAGPSATWQKLAAPPRTEGHPFNVHVLNDGTLVATYSGRRNSNGAFTQSSGVFVSTNGGASWVDRSDANMRRWTKDVVLDPHDPDQNTWYACVFSHWGAPPNEVGGVYRTTDRGQSWQRISDLIRVDSVAVHPDNAEVMYATTETQGLWRTDNLTAANPVFEQDNYPFRQPLRVFFNPYNHGEVWATSFGGGLRVRDCSDNPCDLNVDGKVDFGDALLLMSCLTGPGAGPASGCERSDLSGDADVDLDDTAAFQQCP